MLFEDEKSKHQHYKRCAMYKF